MRRSVWPILIIVGLVRAPSARAQHFQAGDIFISEYSDEACTTHTNWITRIDPVTGIASDFAGYDEGLCLNGGLRFTPDGQRLRVLNLESDTILDFDAAGNSTLVYDAENGLTGPYGSNGLDWDAAGSFFVANEYGAGNLLEFPASGGAPLIRATRAYGGALAVRADGQVYFARYNVYRLGPQGFEILDAIYPTYEALSVATDRAGDVFVSTARSVFRYPNGIASERVLMADNLPRALMSAAIAFSPDERTLYRVTVFDLIAIDVETGAYETIFSIPVGQVAGRGIAVYVPPLRGDMNCNRRLDNFDIDPFVLALTDPDAYAAAYPWCDRMFADMNGDGVVDNFDIDPFVIALAGHITP